MNLAAKAAWAAVAAGLCLVAYLGVRGAGSGRAPAGALLPGPAGELLDRPAVERSGRAMRTGELRGRVLVADFIFTNCPGVCLPMAREMARLQEATRGMDDVLLVSFSVDPERDTPEVLAAYAERQGADPARWLFLRCEKEDVKEIAYHGMKLGSAEDPIFHSPRFVLLDRAGRVRAYYEPVSDPEWLAKILADLAALKETSDFKD